MAGRQGEPHREPHRDGGGPAGASKTLEQHKRERMTAVCVRACVRHRGQAGLCLPGRKLHSSVHLPGSAAEQRRGQSSFSEEGSRWAEGGGVGRVGGEGPVAGPHPHGGFESRPAGAGPAGAGAAGAGAAGAPRTRGDVA